MQNIVFLQVSQNQIARQKAEIPTEEMVMRAQVILDNKEQRYLCLLSWISHHCDEWSNCPGCGEMQNQVSEPERDLTLKVFSVG